MTEWTRDQGGPAAAGERVLDEGAELTKILARVIVDSVLMPAS